MVHKWLQHKQTLHNLKALAVASLQGIYEILGDQQFSSQIPVSLHEGYWLFITDI